MHSAPPSTIATQAMDFRIFEASPGIRVVLLPNPPVYTHVAVSNDFLQHSGMKREDVIGKGHFEIFPENPDDPNFTGERNLRAAFDRLLTEKEPNELPIQRYDIPSPDGSFLERYWKIVNAPVLDEAGEVCYLIHTAVDLTDQVKAEQKVASYGDWERVQQLLNFRVALFEAMNEATSDALMIVDTNGTILLHNRKFVELWGFPEAIIESRDDQAALTYAMNQLVDPQGFLDRVQLLYSQGREKSYDLIRFKDGRIVERNGTPIIGADGFYYGWAWYFRDITDRIRQVQQFRNVVEQISSPILILKGEDLVLEVANEALFDFWQVGPEALNKPFLEILPEMKDQVFVDLLRNVLRTGEPFYGYEVPAVFKRKNGTEETHYVNFSYEPYREADGTITGVLILATDVTGQVIANQKLVESERNFRNVIQQSPVAMCILKGPEFVVEIANGRMFELFGRSSAQMLNRPIFQGLPESREQGLEELLQHVYTTGETFSAFERPVNLPRNGGVETAYINFVYEPFREGDGTISGIVVVAVDVTQQVAASQQIADSEERFRTLANSITQLAWMADADGWIHWYNQRWYDYTGTTLEDMMGWGWQTVHHPDHIDRVLTFVREAWVKGEPWELTFPLRGKDGAFRWFLTRGYPVKDADGKVTRWIGTNTDIDDRKQIEDLLEEKVRERTLELETKTRELEQFTYVSHHDLKEPIRKILIFGEMLKTDHYEGMDEASRRRLDRIIDAAQRMNEALKDVLNFASLTKTEVPTDVDLNQVLQDVQNDLELVITEKEPTLRIDCLPVIRGIPQQMHQLFYNLMNNALKFTRPAEHPTLSVSCRRLEPGQAPQRLSLDPTRAYYEIAVRDNGIGFDPEKADKIFLMFQRLHSKTAYSGTGIGLALARKVVTNHGGTIWADSRPGEGSTFYVLLPV